MGFQKPYLWVSRNHTYGFPETILMGFQKPYLWVSRNYTYEFPEMILMGFQKHYLWVSRNNTYGIPETKVMCYWYLVSGIGYGESTNKVQIPRLSRALTLI